MSWKFNSLHQYEASLARDVDTTVLVACVLREVSILSPGVDPAEEFARVMYVKQIAEPAEADRELIGGPRIIRRGIGQVLALR